MVSDRQPRHLAAILYADVVGFSRMSEADEEGTFLKVRDYLDNFAAIIKHNNGKVIKYAGDAVLAIFNSATDALICAAQVQATTSERNQPLDEKDRVLFRIGLNLGDIIKDRGDVFGDGVNVAARLEALAKPGGICVSGSFYDAIAMKLPFDFEFMGEQQVKNISKPIRAYNAKLQDNAALPVDRPEIKPESSKRPVLKSITALLLLAIMIGTVYTLRQAPENQPTNQKASKELAANTGLNTQAGKTLLLILPFKNLSGSEDQQYFADGITEDLITDLSRISDLTVLARNTSFQYKTRAVNYSALRSELNISHLLDGSIRRSGDQVRVSAQLIDATTGAPIWAERYDRKLNDIFKVQDDVTQNIIDALSIHLSSGEKSALAKARSTSVQAYDLFLQGQRMADVRSKSENALAQQLYLESIQIDPNYSRSYGALAIAKASAALSGWSDSPVEDLDRALELARKAVSLDNSSPHANWALGFTHLFRREYHQAKDAAENSIKHAPNYADGYGLLALINCHLWEGNKAIEYTEKAISLNPHYTYEYLYVLGFAHYILGKYDSAIDYLHKALNRNPNHTRPRVILAASYIATGNIEEAKWETEQILLQRPNTSITKIRNEYAFADHPKRTQLLDHLRSAGFPE